MMRLTKKITSSLAALGLLFGVVGVGGLIMSSPAYASYSEQWEDITATQNQICGTNATCYVAESGNDVMAAKGPSPMTLVVSYQTGGYWCIDGTHGYLAGWSSLGDVVKDVSSSCGVNQRWQIVCTGTGREFWLYDDATTGYTGYYSGTDGDLYAPPPAGYDVFYDTLGHEC